VHVRPRGYVFGPGNRGAAHQISTPRAVGVQLVRESVGEKGFWGGAESPEVCRVKC